MCPHCTRLPLSAPFIPSNLPDKTKKTFSIALNRIINHAYSIYLQPQCLRYECAKLSSYRTHSAYKVYMMISKVCTKLIATHAIKSQHFNSHHFSSAYKQIPLLSCQIQQFAAPFYGRTHERIPYRMEQYNINCISIN